MKKFMVDEADSDGDGLVSWEEFRMVMMKVTEHEHELKKMNKSTGSLMKQSPEDLETGSDMSASESGSPGGKGAMSPRQARDGAIVKRSSVSRLVDLDERGSGVDQTTHWHQAFLIGETVHVL